MCQSLSTLCLCFPLGLPTISRSSIRAFTPASISFLSWGVSGHGYKVALNLKTGREKQRYGAVRREHITVVQKLDYHLPLADLLDSVLQLVSLEENDEDRLVDLVTLRKHHTVMTETDTTTDIIHWQ